jgi:hypothetical protein
VATLSLARDYYDWHAPMPEATTPGTGEGRPTAVGSGISSGPAGTDSAGVPTGLAALPIEAGQANLTPVPRALRDRPEYAGASTIACPTNQSTDREREVAFRTDRRYARLSAIVQPYFPERADAEARVYVSVFAAVRNRDGTVTRVGRGGQDARMTTPQRLVADVTDADEIVLRVQCEAPSGSVLLVGAGLVRD